MISKNRWAVGIDPGLTETGVVLCRENSRRDLEVVESATYSCKTQAGVPDICRVTALAGAVIDLLTEWQHSYSIEAWDVAIEHPVYKRNAKGFQRQIQLYESIMEGILFQISGLMDQCWVTEVNPMTSKSLAGCARNEKPVEQSPFAKQALPKETKEALADSWAHALGTWGVAQRATRTPYHHLQIAIVKERHRDTNGSTGDGGTLTGGAGCVLRAPTRHRPGRS
jgi:Holliday junction resolvasome RuvABC endonuclease subunit